MAVVAPTHELPHILGYKGAGFARHSWLPIPQLSGTLIMAGSLYHPGQC